MARIEYDVNLFLALNQEYETKPLVPAPRSYATVEVEEYGRKKAAMLARRYSVAGQRVLEVGCGRGEVAHALATDFGCQVCAVDVVPYDEWAAWDAKGLSLQVLDITREDVSALGRFDFVYSHSVWEHMRHPFSGLKAAAQLLAPEGRFHLYANLYRGPVASHRYRDVFFPWPHLLFPDSVFIQFCQAIGKPPITPAWLNKLTAAEYLVFSDLVGLRTERVSYTMRPIDEDFYQRFEEALSKYPRFDLERDFIEAVLVPK